MHGSGSGSGRSGAAFPAKDEKASATLAALGDPAATVCKVQKSAVRHLACRDRRCCSDAATLTLVAADALDLAAVNGPLVEVRTEVEGEFLPVR